MSFVQVKGLSKSYGPKVALKDIHFEVQKASIAAFLGPNGAGKSTLFKILLGLRRADSGTVLIDNKPPSHSDLRFKIGYTSQDLSYPGHLKVNEVLRFVQTHFPLHDDISSLQRRFDLDTLANQQVGGLSGGEKRRLGLACALLGRPEILVLDEPTTGLDIESRIRLWNEIELFKNTGGTILLSTHDLSEVSQVADSIVLIDSGTVIFDGALAKILSSINLKKVVYKLGGIQKTELTENSDQFVRELVKKEISFSDLEIHPASLEDAFLKLRGRS